MEVLFKRMSTIVGTLIVVLSMFNGISGDMNCGENCHWTSWYGWNCGYCCNTEGFNQAFRQRGICCHNSSDTNWCLKFCNEQRINLQEFGHCPDHCQPCPTTTMKSTTLLFPSTAKTTSHIHTRTRMTTVPVISADISTTVLQTQSKVPAIGATTIGELPSTGSVLLPGITSDSPPSIDTGTTLSTSSTESVLLPGITSDSPPSIDIETTSSKSSTESVLLPGITSDSPPSIDTGTTSSASSTESIFVQGITSDSPPSIDTGTTLSTMKTTDLDLTTNTQGQSTKNQPLSTGMVMSNMPTHSKTLAVSTYIPITSAPEESSMTSAYLSQTSLHSSSQGPLLSDNHTQDLPISHTQGTEYTEANSANPTEPPLSANQGITEGNVTSMPTTASHDYSNEPSTETSTTSSGIDLSDSISTILSSGMSSMNHMISSSTEDCRAECAGKVSRDSCFIECFSRPCLNMLTLISPCLFLLGVVVGSSVTCCINCIIKRKKRKEIENSVWPFKGYN